MSPQLTFGIGLIIGTFLGIFLVGFYAWIDRRKVNDKRC